MGRRVDFSKGRIISLYTFKVTGVTCLLKTNQGAALPVLLDDGAGGKGRAPFVGALRWHKFSLPIVSREYRPHINLFRQNKHPHTVIIIQQFPSSNFPHLLPFVPRLFQLHKLQQVEPGLDGFDAVGAAEGDVGPAAPREVVRGQDLVGIPRPEQQLLLTQLDASPDSLCGDEQCRDGEGEAFAIGSLHSLEERDRHTGTVLVPVHGGSRCCTGVTVPGLRDVAARGSSCCDMVKIPRAKRRSVPDVPAPWIRAGNVFVLHKF